MRQRKRRGWRANLAMVGLTVLLAGFSSPDEKANELFVRAVGEVEKGQRATAQSYVQAAEHYKAALVKLEEIISDYAATSIAVRLASGEAKLAGVTYAEFKRTIVPITIERADAETNPLDAAVLVAETIAVTDSKVRAMGDIAVAFAEAGRFDRALDLAETIADTGVKAAALGRIGTAAVAANDPIGPQEREILHRIVAGVDAS